MRTSGAAAGFAALTLWVMGAPGAVAQSLANPAPSDQTYVSLAPGASVASAASDVGSPPVQQADAASRTSEGGVAGYFDNWFARVEEAQESQPHWMTPLVTVTPRLEQEIRYDQYWEHLPTGANLDNYGTGKGLELIPTTTNEVIFGIPAYEESKLGSGRAVTGWGDWPVVLIKQRLFSENEQNGNAIVTAFLQVIARTGSNAYTGKSWIVTPTIAGGKGWGDFDIQATMGVIIPATRLNTAGSQLSTNVTFQYHLLKYLWPEFELNDTIWLSGDARGGKDQLFLTPGLILGRFVIDGRLRAAIGAGYQFAVSPDERSTGEILPTYNHNWVLSARLSF